MTTCFRGYAGVGTTIRSSSCEWSPSCRAEAFLAGCRAGVPSSVIRRVVSAGGARSATGGRMSPAIRPVLRAGVRDRGGSATPFLLLAHVRGRRRGGHGGGGTRRGG